MIRNLIVRVFIFYYCILSLPGCISGQDDANRTDSQKIDSLINVQKLNSRTILVNFGYDAVSAINTESGIVIIDAGISTGLTSRYRKIIENEFSREDLIYVINTHGHHDHNRGNSVFSNCKIVGHVNCLEEISQWCSNQEKIASGFRNIVEDYEKKLKKSVQNTTEWKDLFTQRIRYLNAYYDLKFKLPFKKPDITFSDSLKLDLEDITVEMIYFGKCHSTSDILIHVPEIKTIFTGDLFSRYGRPDIIDTSVTDRDKWKRAINWIENRTTNIEKVIDGHGEILSINDLNLFKNNILRRCCEQ